METINRIVAFWLTPQMGLIVTSYRRFPQTDSITVGCMDLWKQIKFLDDL